LRIAPPPDDVPRTIGVRLFGDELTDFGAKFRLLWRVSKIHAYYLSSDLAAKSQLAALSR
jgi:hypothetical protein